MRGRMGEVQRDVLAALAHHDGEWFAGCGWVWNTELGTARLMDSLVRRGFVRRVEAPDKRMGVIYRLNR